MIQARKLCHSVRLLNPILLASAIDLSQATSMQFTVLTRQADCAGLFQPNHFFKCGRRPQYSARSLVVSQPACQAVEYPFSQVSLPFIQSTNFDFRDWIMSSVIFLSSPLSLHSATRRCILYFLYQNRSMLTMKWIYLLDKAFRNQAVGVTKVPV